MGILTLLYTLFADTPGNDTTVTITLITAVSGVLVAVIGVIGAALNARINHGKEAAREAKKETDEKFDEHDRTLEHLVRMMADQDEKHFKEMGELRSLCELKDAVIADGDRYEGEAEAHIDEWWRVAPERTGELTTKRPTKRKRGIAE